MATFIVTTNDLDGINDAGGSNFVFVNEGILVSNASDGINLDGGFQTVSVRGNVVSSGGTGVRLGAAVAVGGFHSLTIGSSGSVQGVDAGVRMEDGFSTLLNDGEILGVGSSANGGRPWWCSPV